MRNDELDKQIKSALLQESDGTNIQDELLKERIWKSIMNDIQPKKKRKRGMRWGVGLASVAVLLIGFVFFSMYTDPGQATIQRIKDLFVEEKKEEIEIEGQKEETNVHLEANEELSYVIYIDEERYKMVKSEEGDRIEMLEEVEGDFPEVYMEISRRDNTTTEEVKESIRQEILNQDNMGIRREERTAEPIEADMIQGMGLDGTGDQEAFASEWNTPIHRYYITDTQNDQVFVIKQVYFLEAAEGHGARFHYMLESFEIVE